MHGILYLAVKLKINIVKKMEIPYFRFSEKDQIGNCSGDLFINAIESLMPSILKPGPQNSHLFFSSKTATFKKSKTDLF